MSANETDGSRPPLAVGIDLGTTYSAIAHINHHGQPASIPNSNGDVLTSSVVLFGDDGTVIGKEAVLAAPLEPDKVADCVKRDIGNKHYRKPIKGELLPPEVISGFILRRVKDDAERKLGPIKKAVITVPAYFDETRRRATMDAGVLAGLEVLDIINEPTAAAIAYGYQAGFLDRSGALKGDQAIRTLVYDLGGGTFDVTLVEMSNQSFKALATDGECFWAAKTGTKSSSNLPPLASATKSAKIRATIRKRGTSCSPLPRPPKRRYPNAPRPRCTSTIAAKD